MRLVIARRPCESAQEATQHAVTVAAEQSADAGTGLLTVGRAGRSRQTTVCAVARQQTAQTGLRMVAAKVDAKLPIAEGEKLQKQICETGTSTGRISIWRNRSATFI